MSHITAELMGFFNDMKTCTKCKIEKELGEFGLCKKSKGGLKSNCKECRSIEGKEYVLNNKQKIKEYKLKNYEYIKKKNREYYLKNKESISEKFKTYKSNNKDIIKIKRREKYLINKEKISDKCKEYRLKNSDKIKLAKNKYYLENKEAISIKGKQYKLTNKDNRNKRERERRETDSLHKLKCNIRGLIGGSIRKQGYSKDSRTCEILGCSFEEFKIHLENKFTEGMNWDNAGKWHLDHIIPISSAKNEEDIIKLNHYTNFQPLWAIDNLTKGNRY